MTTTEEAIAQLPQEAIRERSRWPYLVVLLLVAFLYRAVLVKLVHDWWHIPEFSHGFIVPLFSLFVLWRNRSQIIRIPRKPAWAGVAVVCAALGLLVIGVLGAELFLARVSGILLIIGLTLTFWGRQRLRRMAFPLLFLLFAVPIPAIVLNHITFPLQLLSSRFAADVLPLLDVPVHQEGNVIRLAIMPLEVAEACSGIGSLLSLSSLAVIFGYFLQKSVTKRIILCLLSIPIAVICNVLRIVGTGLCVQYWDPDKAVGFFHAFSGWLLFVVALCFLYLVNSAMSLRWFQRGKA